MSSHYERIQRGRTYGASIRILAIDSDCVYCGFPANTVDHVVPIAAGGLTIDENLVPACFRCNSLASSMVFVDFDEKRKYILDRRRPEILRAAP